MDCQPNQAIKLADLTQFIYAVFKTQTSEQTVPLSHFTSKALPGWAVFHKAYIRKTQYIYTYIYLYKGASLSVPQRRSTQGQ